MKASPRGSNAWAHGLDAAVPVVASHVVTVEQVRARRRTYRLMKVRDLTPEEMREVERLIEAEQRDREREERTRYESHQWDATEDDAECIVCGVTWKDCEAECEA